MGSLYAIGNLRHGRFEGVYPAEMFNPKSQILDALRWLTAHQVPDGRWSSAESTKWCDGRRIGGSDPTSSALNTDADSQCTAYAILAFLQAGRDPVLPNPGAEVLRSAIEWLITRQQASGAFASGDSAAAGITNAACTLALLEATAAANGADWLPEACRACKYLLTDDPRRESIASDLGKGGREASGALWRIWVVHFARLLHDRPWAVDIQVGADGVFGLRGVLGSLAQLESGAASLAIASGCGLARLVLEDDSAGTAGWERIVAALQQRIPSWTELPSDPGEDWFLAAVVILALHSKYPNNPAWWRWEVAWDRSLTEAIASHQERKTSTCELLGSWSPDAAARPDLGTSGVTALLALCLGYSAGQIELVWPR